jgi:ribosomal protein S18 acetylase RimI-like enzyme
MNAIFQQISEQDISSLLGLMREFYQQQHMRFDEVVAAKAVTKLLADPSLGQICFIYRGTELAGYFVLTICVSLEFHGNFALLDELYVREAFRRQKLGTTVISFVENLCRQKGIKALRLEVGRANDGAQRLYRASGFTEDARYLYTKWL